MNSIKRHLAAFLIGPILILSTSAAVFAQGKPKTPPILTERVGLYTTTEFDADVISYNSAMNLGDYDQARVIRDKVIYRVMGTVDLAYGNFEANLFNTRATRNVILDIVENTLTAVIGITDKASLVGLLAGLRGGRNSYDKNFFQQQTLQVVIQTMRASRLRVATKIEESLSALSAADYPLNQGLQDTIQYLGAGTLQAGLSEAVETASQSMQAARSAAVESRAMRMSRSPRPRP